MTFLYFLMFLSSNFLYQATNDKDWEKAVERSFFQIVAILFTLFVIYN
jgi:hypothetical protein